MMKKKYNLNDKIKKIKNLKIQIKIELTLNNLSVI